MKKLINILSTLIISSTLSVSVISCRNPFTPKNNQGYKLPEIDNLKFTNRFHAQNPTTGMMNDIQGGFYREGKWHVYFLQNADGIFDQDGNNHGKFGSVWYHVTTVDWINWNYEGPAVPKYTTKYGDQASGTFYEDKENSFGYGSEAIIAITTSYSDAGQNIMMFYSIDGGYKFNPVKEEPILWNPHKETNENFRDPYFFKKNNKFIMYIAEENEFGVYVSDNPLGEYKKTGSFKAQHPMLECPNLFEINIKDSVEKKWVALYGGNGGWGENADNLSSGTYYVTGSLDEKTFVFKPDNEEAYKRLDFGPDYYAAKFMSTSYKNTDIDSLITTGWVNNWSYNFSIPNDGRLGNMSLAREIKLLNKGTKEKPDYTFETNFLGFNKFQVLKTGNIINQTNFLEHENLKGQYFKTNFILKNIQKNNKDNVEMQICDDQYNITILFDFLQNQISVKRLINISFNYGKEEFEKLRVFKTDLSNLNGDLNFEVYVDKTIVEFKFIDGTVFSMLKFIDAISKEDIKFNADNIDIEYQYYQVA
ncbi:levanbiose-producing levanase [Spiroplasma gladiatoris]|uniref:Levanbiose-producing levanase n=1 Tax=Spiroplasma gladiatoris TaxID=2143 RepID=A0A4P7AI92_9MOLU|nr:glycoside hydrolase family 32 protein [Spiroplasma gladiatoris]QBQ07972.1 levanbiose-producing levanase [Spiroplasma gladiatoris]